MMTPKEALIKDGTVPVKEGRGRLSREAIERCKYLVSQGWSIKGYEVSAAAPVSTSTVAPAAPVVKKVAVNNEKVIADIVYTYPEDQYKALDANGKVIPGLHNGMREVCNTCRVSLVGHGCDNPTIYGDQKVTIVRR